MNGTYSPLQYASSPVSTEYVMCRSIHLQLLHRRMGGRGRSDLKPVINDLRSPHDPHGNEGPLPLSLWSSCPIPHLSAFVLVPRAPSFSPSDEIGLQSPSPPLLPPRPDPRIRFSLSESTWSAAAAASRPGGSRLERALDDATAVANWPVFWRGGEAPCQQASRSPLTASHTHKRRRGELVIRVPENDEEVT